MAEKLVIIVNRSDTPVDVSFFDAASGRVETARLLPRGNKAASFGPVPVASLSDKAKSLDARKVIKLVDFTPKESSPKPVIEAKLESPVIDVPITVESDELDDIVDPFDDDDDDFLDDEDDEDAS